MVFTIFGGIRIIGANPLTAGTAHATSYPYTANLNEMASLGASDMPEHPSNYCGVSVALFNIGYAYYKAGQSDPYHYQSDIANLMNSSGAVSPWGEPTNGTPTFKANISLDGGEDPRNMAWTEYTATPYGYYYHNYIYPSWNGVGNAVRNFASDYGLDGTNVPIAVMINGGSHIVAVGGVYADNDPSLYYNTVNISMILVYDPWYNSGYSPINYYNNTGFAEWQYYTDWIYQTKWWGIGYDTNNGYDPEPHTNPGYYNAPTQAVPNHWNTNYVTVEQDYIPPSTYSENIALDNTGSPVAHN